MPRGKSKLLWSASANQVLLRDESEWYVVLALLFLVSKVVETNLPLVVLCPRKQDILHNHHPSVSAMLLKCGIKIIKSYLQLPFGWIMYAANFCHSIRNQHSVMHHCYNHAKLLDVGNKLLLFASSWLMLWFCHMVLCMDWILLRVVVCTMFLNGCLISCFTFDAALSEWLWSHFPRLFYVHYTYVSAYSLQATCTALFPKSTNMRQDSLKGFALMRPLLRFKSEVY